MEPAHQRGVSEFIRDLGSQGIVAELDGVVVVYPLDPVQGALAGQTVMTGVSVEELQEWPLIPPHWIHLPQEVRFEATNTDQQGVLPGWNRHSRDITPWDTTCPPASAWLAHVRGVLGKAI